MGLKARYLATLSLTEEERNRVEALQKKGVKVIDIFRKGLEVLEKKS